MSTRRGITFGVVASQRKSDLRNRLGRSILKSAKPITRRRPGRGTLLETKMGVVTFAKITKYLQPKEKLHHMKT